MCVSRQYRVCNGVCKCFSKGGSHGVLSPIKVNPNACYWGFNCVFFILYNTHFCCYLHNLLISVISIAAIWVLYKNMKNHVNKSHYNELN